MSKGAEVVMYSSRFCPFCFRAKAVFKDKNVALKELIVDGNAALRQEMMSKSGRHTVPQIWIGDTHVGGCDDLLALERANKLDALLGR